MNKVIVLQLAASVVAAAIGGCIAGWTGMLSAMLGGLVCIVPNFLFAVYLKTLARQQGSRYPVGFLLGEFAKLALTVALLLVVVKSYASLNWFSLLIGLLFATQTMFLAFWKKS